MVVTARTVGLVQHANGMNAGSAARPRNGARQLLTAEKIDEGDKVVRTGGRAKDMRMQCLPSIARFRLMRRPLATHSRLITQDWLAGCVHESARSFYCRRRCDKLSALQEVYRQQHNHQDMFFLARNQNAQRRRPIERAG